MRGECCEVGVWGLPQLEILSAPTLRQPEGRFAANDGMMAQ